MVVRFDFLEYDHLLYDAIYSNRNDIQFKFWSQLSETVEHSTK